jgi:HAD superfamily hydrolase (TIGR01458 family)
VAWARENGLPLRFVTNTATRSGPRIREELAAIGIPVESGELVTAPLAARAWIMRQGLTPHCLVHPSIAADFEDLRGGEPDCVVIGDARDGLSYDALNGAFRLLLEGAPLIGIGMNRKFREAGAWMLDAGPFIHALAWAAEVDPIVMGKPSGTFYRQLLTDLDLAPDSCLMVGDDADADVAAPMALGMRGALVRTGKYRPGDERRCPEGALLLDSVADLPAVLEG